ncbi:HCP-like protein [Cucurbitaria berberidis CBS 394.84]|uniref:HCP-like protein n=1 Tax=Cucurbitaria berberidis CBS 394.84 TaxID=1168544 RepID=A0A9P4G7J9_9PLEO|nr:HCP-like protein [Cucurbitaria berberidis CBS 394.84]KAF1840497.1 HCP-like protein [Cucurbitaria berberidis CBS 394.84]
MTLKDLLKKRDRIKDEGVAPPSPKGPALSPDVPEFQFFRTTTTTQETIEPPSFPGDPTRDTPLLSPEPRGKFGRFRKFSNASSQNPAPGADDGRAKQHDKLTERLHFGRTRSSSSTNIPDNLPEVGGDGVARTEEDEAKWEKRATVLVTEGLQHGTSAPPTPSLENGNPLSLGRPTNNRSNTNATVHTSADEENIQEAIRLHEKGSTLVCGMTTITDLTVRLDLEASTALFGRLADPNGANNALAQVLYGLALRHAWGCEPDQEQAVHYLSMAASNSAEVEKLALGAGMKKGGAAKGELVLAMYELANCFRNGWGIKKDPAAAKQYYETAANLGDTDAMNEVAWCYTEGFGTKKDKFKAAQFLRLAESKGNKTLGNTW